jgi:aspartate kinase
VALGASQVEFYKDVAGIYSADPKMCAGATLFSSLSYGEVLAIVEDGARVLHPRCLRLAEKNGLPLHVLSFYDPGLCSLKGTLIGPRLRQAERSCIFEGVHEPVDRKFSDLHRF